MNNTIKPVSVKVFGPWGISQKKSIGPTCWQKSGQSQILLASRPLCLMSGSLNLLCRGAEDHPPGSGEYQNPHPDAPHIALNGQRITLRIDPEQGDHPQRKGVQHEQEQGCM